MIQNSCNKSSNFIKDELYLCKRHHNQDLSSFLLKKEINNSEYYGHYVKFSIDYKHFVQDFSNKFNENTGTNNTYLSKFLLFFYMYRNTLYFNSSLYDADINDKYKSTSYLQLPACLQNCKLGSLLLRELLIFREEFYPNFNLSELALDKMASTDNEERRDKLYSNIGYDIIGDKAIFNPEKVNITQTNFNYDIKLTNKKEPKECSDLLNNLYKPLVNKFFHRG